MIHGLKPYPAYKDSGVSWLGKVPEHWEVKRLKRVAKFNPSKSEFTSFLTSNGDATFLPMERVGVEGRIDAKEIKPASDLLNGGFTYFRRGDVLIAKITPCFENGKGACLEALPTEIGFGSTEFIVSRPMPSILPTFLYRITTSSEFRTLGADAMTGAAGQKRVPTTFVGNFQATIPPLSEQSAIVRYLDHFDRRIRHYIREKRKLIKLLEEQKQAIIHQAVTCGLDPNVKLKSSGVEWLGDVPEHWEVLRSRYVFREIDRRSVTGQEAHLSMSQKYGLIRSDQIETHRLMSESYTGAKICACGDLVLNRLKAHLGVFALAPEQGLVSPDYTVLRQTREIIPSFFEFVYRTPACRVELRQRAKGIVEGFWRLYTDDFYQIPVPVPPKQEQESIVTAIEEKTRQIKEIITQTEIEISLLREYRTRLIADVVTGKLDVREASVNLPEENDETEVPDDELAGDEETTEEDLESEPEEE